jgi:hypothetical protein
MADPAIHGSGGDGDRTHPHGMVMLKDGTIIIKSVAKSWLLMRNDCCGQPKWMVRDYCHPLMTPDADGVWSWYGEGSSYTKDQYMIRFDPETGQELEGISIIKGVIWPHPEGCEMMGLPEYFHKGRPREHENRSGDLCHTSPFYLAPMGSNQMLADGIRPCHHPP